MSSSYRHFDRRIREWALQHFRPGAEILDVGPGRGKFSCLLPEYRAGMDCVEVFEPFVAKYNLPSLYRNVRVKNVLDFEFMPGAYDLVLLGDVIDHLTPDEAGGLLDRIHRAGAAAIVAVPYLLPQGIIEENPFEAHKQSDLTPERMTTLYPKLMPLCTDNKYGVYISRTEIPNNISNNAQAPRGRYETTPSQPESIGQHIRKAHIAKDRLPALQDEKYGWKGGAVLFGREELRLCRGKESFRNASRCLCLTGMRWEARAIQRQFRTTGQRNNP